MLLSFLGLVLLPAFVVIFYLYSRAADQYASNVGFTVRTEEISSAFELLGGVSGISGSSSSDTDILYEFIQSQELVSRIDASLDLREIFSKAQGDPVFAFDTSGTIEDLVDYWPRMVNIFYDPGTGLIELRVKAFDPEDATAIAQAIFAESSLMINDLSAIARDDATRFARIELERAEERLRSARQAVTKFRTRNQIIDPQADIQVQMGLLNTLQQQLAEALIELDLLRETTRPGDARITQAERRIMIIEDRISQERNKFGLAAGTNQGLDGFSSILGEFERLLVDREFAEQAYLAARSAFDTAQAEAQRQSRYLAAYLKPTSAERAVYPKRGLTAFLIFAGLLVSWIILVLIAYSLKDRR
nr:sugar transporter [Pseudaestuariivita rosea]